MGCAIVSEQFQILMAKRDVIRSALMQGSKIYKKTGSQYLARKYAGRILKTGLGDVKYLETTAKKSYGGSRRKIIRRIKEYEAPQIQPTKKELEPKTKLTDLFTGSPFFSGITAVSDFWKMTPLFDKETNVETALEYANIPPYQREQVTQIIETQKATPEGSKFWTEGSVFNFPDIKIPNPFEGLADLGKYALLGIGGLVLVMILTRR